MKCIVPQSAEDFERYYQLRYLVLRKPWNQPFESVKDNHESEALHAMIVGESGEALGVCRMQFNSVEEAQIRYMGIREDMRGKGLGKILLDHFEKIATEHQMKRVILQARENAVDFYLRNGYQLIEKTNLLFGVIQHYLMRKDLM